MKKQEIKNVKDMLKDKDKFNLENFSKLYIEKISSYPMPQVTINKPMKEIKPGGKIHLKIKGFPFPVIDFYSGKYSEKKRTSPNLPIYAYWRTTNGPYVESIQNKKSNNFILKVPDNVTNGLLIILFPVEEYFGPPNAIQEFPNDVKLEYFKKLKIGINNKINSNSFCPPPFYPGDKPIRYYAILPCSNPSCTTLPSYTPPILEAWPWYSIKIPCYNCVIDCPKDAIEINEYGHCHINTDKCDGQKYTDRHITSTEHERVNEIVCWKCFNEDDNTFSTKCDKVFLRKVLHLNPDAPRQEVPCCAGCNIDTLCPEGAISTVNNTFTADKKLCNGCMLCYYGIQKSVSDDVYVNLCGWNCGALCNDSCEAWERDANLSFNDGAGGTYTRNIHNNYTMRMTAHIDHKFTIVFGSIILELPVQSGIPLSFSKSLKLCIWGDDYEEIPINLDSQGIFHFNMKEKIFSKSIHFGLFQTNGHLFGFQNCGLNIPIKSIGGKRNSSSSLFGGGEAGFNTHIGKFRLSYTMK